LIDSYQTRPRFFIAGLRLRYSALSLLQQRLDQANIGSNPMRARAAGTTGGVPAAAATTQRAPYL